MSERTASERAATGTTAAPGTKPVARVHVTWAGDQRFDAGRPGGPTLRLDGRGETGQSPVDAVLSALAGCVSIDVVEILAKRRTPVQRLEVAVEGERFNGTPKRIVAVTLALTIDGAGIDALHAERAIDLALNKYCSVRESLSRDIPVTWTLVLNGTPGAPGEARAAL